MTVNTLGEVQEADGYIIELGLRKSGHPAASLDEDEIRDKMRLGEWYVRTGDPTEEQELMGQVDEQIDHHRLPAYLILGSHPQDATDAVVIYLDEVDTAEEVWQVLEEALSVLRDLNTEDDNLDMSKFAEHLTGRNAWIAANVGSVAIQYITFAGLA